VLARWLLSFGFTVKVIDFCSEISTDDLVAITKKHIDSTTVAIGVSSTFWRDNSTRIVNGVILPNQPLNTPNWTIVARSLIEPLFPKLDWLLGGANSDSLLDEAWIRFHEYSEDAIIRYLDGKLSKWYLRPPYDIKTATNTYMDGLGITPHEALGLEWGRGCQFKCSFCRYKNIGKKKNSYLRDSKLVRQDIINNYERYGTTRYIYVDDTTNESNEKIADMVEVAQSLPFRIEWVGYGRLDLIGTNKHTIKALEDSGLRSMFFGVETFNKEACKRIGKGWIGVHGKEFLLELKDKWGEEVSFLANFITGLSPETPDEVEQTVQWCIDNQIHSFNFIPLFISSTVTRSASEFDRNYEKYGYRFPDPKRVQYWESDYWTSDTAREQTAGILSRAWPHSKPAAFHLAAISSATGETMKEAMHKPPDNSAVTLKIDTLISDYVTYQLNLKD